MNNFKRAMQEKEAEAAKRVKVSKEGQEQIRDVDSLSPLEKLPQELLWKLLDYAPEAITHLRPVSRQLNGRVDNYAKKRNNIRIAERVLLKQWKGNKKGTPPPTTITCTICVPNHLTGLFELRLKQLEPACQQVIKRTKNISSYMRSVDQENKGKKFYTLRYVSLEKHGAMMASLNHALGRFVSHVHLIQCHNLDVANMLLDGNHFDKSKLEVETEELNMTIMNLVLSPLLPKINEMHLCVDAVTLPDPVDALMQLSSHLKSLMLWGFGEHCFGLPNADWPSIISRMFSYKLDKLQLDQIFPANFFNDSATALKKKLPTLGKEVWFGTSCAVYDKASHYAILNEYCVNESCFGLKISHFSRKDELPLSGI